jgi:ferredoxin
MEIGEKLQKQNPLNQYLSLSGFYGAVALSRPDIVNAKKIKLRISPIDSVDTRKLEIDPQEMSRKIKAFGLHLGAAKVRIARLKQEWVYSHHGPPQYGKTVELNHKYIICLAFYQDPFMVAGGASQSVDLEIGYKYAYASFISTIIANFIRRLGWSTRQLPTFDAPYLIPPVFIDAGMGEDGRCGYVVTKEFGNNFRPGAVATDLPLIPDKPVDFGLQDFCDKCKICAEKCPSGAIPKGGRETVRGVRKWQIDAEKCFDYWIVKGSSCGVCQAVCPWNHANNVFHNSFRELGSRVTSLRKFLINGERIFYGNKKPKPVPKWLTLP